MTGIPQVVIMTKVDVACPHVKENLKMIYRSKKIKERMEQCSNDLGIPLTYIFPVKNYHEEINNNNEIDILLLMALTSIVNFANDFAIGKVNFIRLLLKNIYIYGEWWLSGRFLAYHAEGSGSIPSQCPNPSHWIQCCSQAWKKWEGWVRKGIWCKTCAQVAQVIIGPESAIV
ncbi:hypothetical protein QTP86_022419 [Hemibagrus guttatus]|nr:hypothetical protein QTP86_022419 [Hemibagrus guttatus]